MNAPQKLAAWLSVPCYVAFLLVVWLIPHSWADAPAASPSEQVETIAAQWSQAVQQFYAAIEAAKTDGEAAEVKTTAPDILLYSRRMLSIAESKPDDAGAREALHWILDGRGRRPVHQGSLAEIQNRAVELILDHHINDLEFASEASQYVIVSLSRETLLTGIVERSDDRTTQGQARIALARLLMAKAVSADALEARSVDEEGGGADGKAFRKYVRSTNPPTIRRQVDALLNEVLVRYADVPFSRKVQIDSRRTLGKAAESLLDEFHNLGVGKKSPEIDGVDLSGTPLKLSDHRGKIVLIVFWASWCGPCVAEIPHEREIVERLKGKPFALLGVNGDEDKTAARKVIESEKVNWLNWSDPVTSGGAGPIVESFHVHAWPSTFLIDANGIIRAKNKQGKALDEAIDALLLEAQKAAGTGLDQ